MDGLELRLLGEVEVHDATGAVGIGGLRQRMLLARLAVARRGAPVPAGVLLDDVWDGAPRADVVKTAVNRLRTALGTDTIVRDGGGYRLGALLVDADRFERDLSLARATSTDAANAIDGADHARHRYDALDSMWRGRAYGDLADLPWVRLEAERLEELRIGAAEECLALLLEAGQHDVLLDRVGALRHAHPWRDRLVELHMLAAYRSGRQRDALLAYREHADTLRAELGLEPTPRLSRLELAVLEHDAAVLGSALDRVHSSSFAGAPGPRTSYVATNADRNLVGDVVAALANHRCVTVAGPAGVGKSRLAGEASRSAVRSFADGIVTVDVRSVVDASHLDRAALAGFGVTDAAEADDHDSRALLLDHLSTRQALLVLDGAERQPDECRDLAQAVLARCAAVRVLVTSQTPIAHIDSVVIELQPMSVPAGGDSASATAGSPAVLLVLDRLGLDHDNPDHIAAAAAIARLADGVPLAVELAAGLVHQTPGLPAPAAIVERFGPRIVESPGLDGVLQAALAALAPADRRLLERLAVFRSHFDLDAAGAVAPSRTDVATALARLLDAGFVHRANGAGRFRLFDSVRDVALADLVRRGGDTTVRARVRDHYVDLVERCDVAIRGHAQLEVIGQLDAELDNLRDLIDRLLGSGDGESAAQVAAPLIDYWYIRGHWAEARTLLRRIANATDGSTTLARARVLRGVSSTKGFADMADFAPELEESVKICESLDEPADLLWSLLQLATVYGNRGEAGRTEQALARSADLVQSIGDPWTAAVHRSFVAMFRIGAGDIEGALADHRRSRSEFHELGDGCWVGRSLWFEGMLLRGLGRSDAAADPLDRAHVLASRVGDRATSAHVSLYQARVARDIRGPDVGERFDRAVHELELIGDQRCAGAARAELDSSRRGVA